MRRTTALLGLLLLGSGAWAQDALKLSGTIVNRKSDTVQVSYNTSRLAYYPSRHYAVLDKKGYFSMKVPIPAGTYTQVELIHGNSVSDLLVQPGDSLVLQADGKRFDSTLHYTGRGAAAQNFIVAHTLVRGRMNQYPMKVRQAVTEADSTFVRMLNTEQKVEAAYLKTHGADLPQGFTRYWMAFYDYYNYFFIQQYPLMHAMAVKRRYTDTIPQENYVVLNKMPEAYNDSFLSVPSYLLYLSGAVESKLKAAGYNFMPGDTLGAQQLQDSVYKLTYAKLPGGSAAYYIAQNLYARAKLQPVGRTTAQFDVFERRWPTSEYLPLLRQQVDIALRTAPGMPAPDVKVALNDGRTVKLSALKDTVVMLHFMASWCRQCVGEIRAGKKVREILANKPVVFAYLSLDDDTAAAKPVLQKMMPGANIRYLDGVWNAAEVQQYGVQTLPAYFIIDKEGKFGARTVPPPHQTMELMMAISKLL